MDSVRVDICYRPLRIGWAISAGDREAFRKAVRLSHTLWGGRFNPIVVVDHEEEAGQLVDLFRVDLILPIGNPESAEKFSQRFPHLIKPFFEDEIFSDEIDRRNKARLLDIHNALAYLRDTREWMAAKDKGVRVYTWQGDDPLADVLLVQLGAYPSATEIGIDYRDMVIQATQATEHTIDQASPIPAEVLEHVTIAYLSRHSLERHYSIEAGWDSPGFFVGDASNLDDLVCHWNLRAADIPLWFIDPNHLQRYTDIIPARAKQMRETVSHRDEFGRQVAVWSRRENIDEARKPLGDLQLSSCPVSIHLWNGLNLCLPMIHFGEVSTLGLISHENGKPKVSFSLSDKPFCGDIWFHTQHLVASLSFFGGLHGDEQHTLRPPFVPELNEFYARTMHFLYDKLRIEPERMGLVVSATDTDAFLYALPVTDLFERVFSMAGFSVKPSPGGLIARQLIGRLGGLQGARVFKIPGVRRLLKTHGPMAAFTKKSALELIGGKDPDNPSAKFENSQDLYIEPRPIGTTLKADAVFSYLVEKGLFRMGAELTCPRCRMGSWTALDELKLRIVCELCGDEFDASRQLVDVKWRYRRSGVLGKEKNALGAVPVVLTLQQLDTSLARAWHDAIYSTSLELEPKNGANVPTCEIDLAWIIPQRYPEKTVVILGECKDQGPIKLEQFEKDIENLRRVADALPRKRFKTFVLLAKLSPFTPDEIERAKILNDAYEPRLILLTARELEPYHIYERTRRELQIQAHGSTPEGLALATLAMYFSRQP